MRDSKRVRNVFLTVQRRGGFLMYEFVGETLKVKGF